jgi:hypothetical protein
MNSVDKVPYQFDEPFQHFLLNIAEGMINNTLMSLEERDTPFFRHFAA